MTPDPDSPPPADDPRPQGEQGTSYPADDDSPGGNPTGDPSSTDDHSERARLYGARVTRWEERTEWTLAILAALFLVAYAWPILQPSLPTAVARLLNSLDGLVWVAFVIDYVVRIVIARHRVRYWLHHLADFAMVVLPALRPLRLLRLLMLLKVLNRRAASGLRGRVGAYVCGAGGILLFCASLAVLSAERGVPGATIKNFGDAVWWSFVTVSTVGYGDITPITATGRLVGIGLMLGGVALLGVITATFASWLVDRVQEVSEQDREVTKADLAALREELAVVRALLERQGVSPERQSVSRSAGDGGSGEV